MSYDAHNNRSIAFPKATRLEVIAHGGRSYVSHGVKDLVLTEQDDGLTVKIFLTKDDEVAKDTEAKMAKGIRGSLEKLGLP